MCVCVCVRSGCSPSPLAKVSSFLFFFCRKCRRRRRRGNNRGQKKNSWQYRSRSKAGHMIEFRSFVMIFCDSWNSKWSNRIARQAWAAHASHKRWIMGKCRPSRCVPYFAHEIIYGDGNNVEPLAIHRCCRCQKINSESLGGAWQRGKMQTAKWCATIKAYKI